MDEYVQFANGWLEMCEFRVLQVRIELRRLPIPDDCIEIGEFIGVRTLRLNCSDLP